MVEVSKEACEMFPTFQAEREVSLVMQTVRPASHHGVVMGVSESWPKLLQKHKVTGWKGDMIKSHTVCVRTGSDTIPISSDPDPHHPLTPPRLDLAIPFPVSLLQTRSSLLSSL